MCYCIYVNDTSIYSILLKTNDGGSGDLGDIIQSFFLAEEETHKKEYPDMDPVLAKLTDNLMYIME